MYTYVCARGTLLVCIGLYGLYGLFSSIMEITDDDGRCNNSAPPHNMVASLKIFQNLIQNLSVGDSSCQIFIQIFVRF